MEIGERALVTGGGGFIGSHLVEALVDAGVEVTVLDDLSTGSRDNLCRVAERIELAAADVRDAGAVAQIVQQCRPQYIYHLAANPSIPASVANPAWDFEVNALGTVRVLDAVRSVGSVERFVLASTGAVYGEPLRVPVTEDAPLQPISPYGTSKLCAEVAAVAAWRGTGLPVVIGRMFNAYGPRMGNFVVRDLMAKLRRNPSRLEVLGTGSQVRDFTYVTDAVDGLLRITAAGEPGKAYNIASGAACSIADLARAIMAAAGHAADTELTFSGESWPGDAQRWEVSIAALEALGYHSQVTLAEGLRRTADWLQTT